MKKIVRIPAIFVLLITGALFVAACGADNQQTTNNAQNSTYERDRTLASLVEFYADNGAFEQALATAGQISSSQVRNEAFVDIGDAYILVDESEKALALAEKISTNYSGVIYYRVVFYYIDAGDLESAIAVVSRISDDSYRDLALSRIAIAYADAGDFESAIAIASEISYDDARGGVFERIVYAYIKAGDFESAIAIADGILPHGYWRSEAFLDIGHAYILVGEFEKALALTEKLHDDDDAMGFNLILKEIAIAYADAGDFEKALAITSEITDDLTSNQVLAHIRDAIRASRS